MTYGPQPGWNPNQPPAGGPGGQPGYPQQPGYPPQPGYPQQPTGPQPSSPQPTGQQPMGQPPVAPPAMGQPVPGQQPIGQPMPGQPMPGQPMPGQAMPGQQPMGQFAPYGQPQAGPAGPRSPLPVVAGALALLMFVYAIYTAIIMLLELTASHASVGLVRLVFHTSLVVETQGRISAWVMTAVVALIGILFLIGALLLFNRKPSGRVLAVIAAVLAIAVSVLQMIQNPAHDINAFGYIFPVVALILVVLCVLPATGQGMRRTPRVRYPQQQQPPIGYAQPPGGYQQPPGGMQR